MKRMLDRVKMLISRPRVVLQASRKLGWPAVLQLVFIRLAGRKEAEYRLRVRGYAHPITIRGGQSTDAWALYELLVKDEYAFFGDLESPVFIIDGGANIGIASLYFLNRYPTARVVAIEPHPPNCEICRKNLAPYGERAMVIQGALWKNPGRLVLDDARGEEWTMSVRSGGPGQTGSVEAFTLPDLIAYGDGKVDLLKLDIEGSEKELFGPGAQDWLPAIRNIVIELHGKDCSDGFFGALEGYEYDLIRNPKDALPVVACLNLRGRADRVIPGALQETGAPMGKLPQESRPG
jgi:FkbM family methyltransferase